MDTLAIVKRIEMRLSEIGMSKAEFYKQSGISSASLSQWRTGIYKPSEKKLIDAARCLDISLEYLVDGIVGEGVTVLANGIRVYHSASPDRTRKLMEEIDPDEFRIVYNAPGCIITVDKDSSATKTDIDQIINLHRVDMPETKNAPALTEKDKRDIAKDLEQMMAQLDDSGDLMFDGNPISDEARASIRTAIQTGLEIAKIKNKERFTPKKYRKE